MMQGYTDQEWAQAVEQDWLKPDLPVSLEMAKARRQTLLFGENTTIRIMTSIHSWECNLKLRLRDRIT